METLPELIASRPAIILSVVVLPQPDGPDEHHELPIADLQVDVFDGVDAVVELVDILQDDLSHPLSTASHRTLRLLRARFQTHDPVQRRQPFTEPVRPAT